MRSIGAFPLSQTMYHDRYHTVGEARIVRMLLLAGWAYEPGDADISDQARHALQDWIDGGLTFRVSASGERLFDPAEIWFVMKRRARDGRDPHFRRRQMRTWRRHVDVLADSATAGPFAVEFRRTFDLTGITPGRALRLRLPVPIARAHRFRSVTPAPDLIAGGAAVCGNRIEHRTVANQAAITVSARFDFSAPSPGGDDEGDDIYLRPREGLIDVSPRVHELAGNLARPGSSVAQAVRAFWICLIENFICAPVHYDQIDLAAPCDRVLDTGVYDCQLGAALFVALCRARGIPARLVGGHFLYRRSPTNHFWAEYRCPDEGWVPVDFIGWDLSCGGDDPVWRDRFFGRLDARLVTQCLPAHFTGAIGVPVPPAWHLLQTAAGDGVDIALTSLDGRPIYSDVVRVLDDTRS